MAEDPDFDEDLDDLGEEPIASKTPAVASKTPAGGGGGGEEVSLFFTSTIGPGEKKQKLLVNTGNPVSAIKQTVGNMFGLNPSDFHLSHGGVTMDENSPLSNYPVKNGDTVLLIPASSAGI
ncbi:MAG: ubiquitin-like domain-containing protein [Candidatus Hodarchaeota archaeon]